MTLGLGESTGLEALWQEGHLPLCPLPEDMGPSESRASSTFRFDVISFPSNSGQTQVKIKEASN